MFKFRFIIDDTFPDPRDLVFEHTYPFVTLLRTYHQQAETPHLIPDRQLLLQTAHLLKKQIEEGPFDMDLLILSVWIHNWMGEFDESCQILERFLSTPRSFSEIAFARWQIVDNLALAKHHAECIAEQKAFYTFACNHPPPEQCLFVLSDGTQAQSWQEMGLIQEWITLVEEHWKRTDLQRAQSNDVFYLARTAAYVYLDQKEYAASADCVQRILSLLQNDLAPEVRMRYQGEAVYIELESLFRQEQSEQARQKAKLFTQQLMTWVPQPDKPQEYIRQYRRLCHNMATTLYFHQHYDLAIPLFEQAIHFGIIPYDAYIWLAASLWATTHQKELVLPYLTQAAQRYSDGGEPWEHFRSLREFQDVQQDQDFQQASQVLAPTF
jgi:hypothetical protein